MLRPNANVRPHQVRNRPHDGCGARQERERGCNLRHDEHAAREPRETVSGRPRRRAKHVAVTLARQGEHRGQPKQQRRTYGNGGSRRDHPDVDCDVESAARGQGEAACRRCRGSRLRQASRRAQPRVTAAGSRPALVVRAGHGWRPVPAAPQTRRSGGHASQQQLRRVQAGDQQHQGCGHGGHDHHWPHRAHELVPHRDKRKCQWPSRLRGGPTVPAGRRLVDEGGHDPADGIQRLGGRRIWGQAAEDHAGWRAPHEFRQCRARQPHVGGARVRYAGRHDAGDN